ncbi:MAG TPA: flagellar type III secretion system pore protein FliP [Planctomycetota bacterium]|nr:flagellar type III secretion system pore protein FliP [Planctomycetota bacterium]
MRSRRDRNTNARAWIVRACSFASFAIVLLVLSATRAVAEEENAQATIAEPAAPAPASASSDAVARLADGLDPEMLPLAVLGLGALAIFAVLPPAILLTTCFPRVLIVLSFLRRAVGATDLPPNFIVVGLALVTSCAVMLPIWNESWKAAWEPIERGEKVSLETVLANGAAPIKRYMLRHVAENDKEALRLFYELSRRGEKEPADPPRYAEEIDFSVVLPAFVVSEIEVAFRIGFLIFLPFVLIDLLVSAVLVSLGMLMLPPALVSLPLKVIVFVLADGWTLLVTKLLAGAV